MEVDACLSVVRSAVLRNRVTSAVDVADESARETSGRSCGSAEAVNRLLTLRHWNPQVPILSAFLGSS